jgi:CDGSH-type Zn-finger protein
MAEVTIKVRENGPLLVTGPIDLVDHTGRRFTVEGVNVALCRCGASGRKPLCDGTHRSIAFDGTCTAD